MRLYPLFEEDGQGGGAEFTPEKYAELEKNYKKLEAEFTKVTQKNSEYSKSEEKVKGWLDFDQALDQLSQEKGINAKALAGQQLDGLIQNLAAGKSPTATQIGDLGKAIDKAEAKGDEATVKKLEALESVVMEQEFEKNLSSIEKEATDDNIPFDRKEFLAFADEWLEDMGISDEDDFDLKLLRKAYQAYEAKILKEQSKQPKIPQLSTSGGAGSPGKPVSNDKIGGIKGAAQKAAAYFK